MNTEHISGTAMKGLIEDPSHLLVFSSKEDEFEYERLDASLNKAIEKVINMVPGHESDYFQEDDWWPNHLRGVELGKALYTEDLAFSLQTLLKGEFANFRIILHVYSDLEMGSAHQFSVLLTASKIWITSDNLGT